MDSVKYQVFISSTYSDLIDERRQVLEVLLMADCIPAGMENFVATDDEQFGVIKKVIDLCDYYILILGRRYGSLNENSGISYTEMEYNYAIDKGIPVLVFVLDDSVEITKDKEEQDDIKRGKLAEFKSKAMRNRLASVWKDKSDLLRKVAISIMRAKNEIKRPGWHRGEDEEKKQLMEEIKGLKKVNEELSKGTSSYNKNSAIGFYEAFYGKKITLRYTEKVFIFTLNTEIDKKTIDTTLDEVYKFISLRITGIKKLIDFESAVSAFEDGYYVNSQDALILRNKYEQLGLISSFMGKDNVEMIEMTAFGREIMNKLNS